MWISRFVWFSPFVLLSMRAAADAANPIDLGNCQNGCFNHDDCPKNSYCVAISSSNSECGACVCEVGFRMQGSQCVTSGGSNGNARTAAPTAAPQPPRQKAIRSGKQEPEDPTPSPSSTGGGVEPLNCADYNCGDPRLDPSDDSNPLKIRTQKFDDRDCKKKINIPQEQCKLDSGTACYGTCLQAEGNYAYCICPYYRASRHCTVEKVGTCDQNGGQLPNNTQPRENMRWMHHDDTQRERSVFARHFAASFDDCVRLCQWAGPTRCRAVNYGPLGGQSVCELLIFSPIVRKIWLRDAPGWREADVVLV